MKSLFLKIFLSFWSALALFVVLAILVTLALRPRSATWEALRNTTLNDAVSRAAAATGTTYVNFSTVSEGHDACQPIGVRWIEPVVTGTNPVIVHPNALGEAQMAAQTISTLHLG